MLVLISPSKTLDLSDNAPKEIVAATPEFQKEALDLVHILQNYSSQELGDLMSISAKLAELNYQRFQMFEQAQTKPAIYMYKGDVYDGFELEKYGRAELDFANKTLRIISGLYGLLIPLDLIAPYRLEMGINLPNSHGRNLYNFWQEKLTKSLNDMPVKHIVNLASQEYFSSITSLNKPVTNIIFKESHQDGYKIIGIHAKKARGVMANFIILHKIDQVSELKEFNLNGYKFSSKFSTAEEYVFLR